MLGCGRTDCLLCREFLVQIGKGVFYRLYMIQFIHADSVVDKPLLRQPTICFIRCNAKVLRIPLQQIDNGYNRHRL